MGLHDRDYYREHYAEQNDMVYRRRDATYHPKRSSWRRLQRLRDAWERFFSSGASASSAPPSPPPFTATSKPAPRPAPRHDGPPDLLDLPLSFKVGFVLVCAVCVGFLLYYRR
jgi:hypothetical protein